MENTVSTNLQNLFNTNLQLSYYVMPTVIKLSSYFGPAAGGSTVTVYGNDFINISSNFGANCDNYKCN